MQSSSAQFGRVVLEESDDVTLYESEGHLYSLEAFVRSNLSLIEPIGQELLGNHFEELPTLDLCPLRQPFVRIPPTRSNLPTIQARASGIRSALVPQLGLKLKGCRPEEATFPEWYLNDDLQLVTRQIPFGILTAEGVMREILGHFFMLEHQIPISSVPVGVMHYQRDRTSQGFCLVSRLDEDARMESRIDCGGITLHRLIRLATSAFSHEYLGHEVRLRGVDSRRYTRTKAELMCRIHFNGGFRGILNSNIGNDITAASKGLALCDFDTFRLRPIPMPLDSAGIRVFVAMALCEVVKSSLPFVDYLDLSSTDDGPLRSALVQYYIDHSSLYSEYRTLFEKRAAARGWSREHVQDCFTFGFALDVIHELLQELIPNSKTFSTFRFDAPYVPHYRERHG